MKRDDLSSFHIFLGLDDTKRQCEKVIDTERLYVRLRMHEERDEIEEQYKQIIFLTHRQIISLTRLNS